MTLEAFYAKIGGNSADVLRRLPSEAMVRKFIGKYPADTSWGSLESAINSQDWEAAFRAAHTLKGVAQNLGFQKLYLSSTALTEALRGPKPLTDPALREAVAMDQAALLTAIQELEGSRPCTEKTRRRVGYFSLRPSNSPLRVGSKRLFVRVSARRGLFYDINWPELCHPVVWCVIPRLRSPEALGGCCRTAVPGGCGIFPPGDRPAPRRR